jgi:hypothetical protein
VIIFAALSLECLLSADWVEKLFGRAHWLHRGEYHFVTQRIANPDSKDHPDAKRYSTVGVCFARLPTKSTQSAQSGCCFVQFNVRW